MKADAGSLEGILALRLRELRKILPQAQKGSESEVHRARVIARRLKAALDVGKPLLSAESRREVSRAIRRIRRALGELRDVDVMLAHLQSVPGERNVRATCWLAEKLQARRSSSLSKGSKRVSQQAQFLQTPLVESIRIPLKGRERDVEKYVRLVASSQLQRFAHREVNSTDSSVYSYDEG